MNRKKYMRDVYSKYWLTAREEIYGFTKYDKNLCDYICSQIPVGSKLLDVAIGTGFPFARHLQDAGYNVHGIDISPLLVARCRELNPEVICETGDAERMGYLDNYFDCTYCFHSTWYFPDLLAAIDEMIRVTRTGGLAIFDIQNLNNQEIIDDNENRLREHTWAKRLIRRGKNAVRMIRNRVVPVNEFATGFGTWQFCNHETPSYPEIIYNHLNKRMISNFQVMLRTDDDAIETTEDYGSFGEFRRLVFVIQI